MKIKIITSHRIEVIEFSEKQRADKKLPFRSIQDILIDACDYCRQTNKQTHYEFFTNISDERININGIKITHFNWLDQNILVCVSSVEELSRFEQAFSQIIQNEWKPEYLNEKIENLDVKIPRDCKKIAKFYLRDISTFNFGDHFSQKIKNKDRNIVITLVENPRYLCITRDKVFWLDKNMNRDQSDKLIGSWERYKK